MLPTRVTILGEVFEVQRPKTIIVEGEDADGFFDYEMRVIGVVAGLGEREAMSTLLHEMAHAWLDVSSFGLILSLSSEREEALVLAIERQFLPVVAQVLGSSLLTPARDKKKAAKRRRK
jgi:Zn-dependent peptidase ImmA (M78 family)